MDFETLINLWLYYDSLAQEQETITETGMAQYRQYVSLRNNISKEMGVR